MPRKTRLRMPGKMLWMARPSRFLVRALLLARFVVGVGVIVEVFDSFSISEPADSPPSVVKPACSSCGLSSSSEASPSALKCHT
jgi:hypothetical protein